jgi:antitoxin component YwqK of YwqJK toxin-antitoxin module
MALKVKEEDLEHDGFDGGGSEKLRYQGLPFTGFIVEYYPNGNVLCELEYQNGFQDGYWREYHENGQLASEFKTHNNCLVTDSSKYFDENGNPISQPNTQDV